MIQNINVKILASLTRENADIKVLIKRIHEDACLPEYQHDDDSGCDLYSVEDVLILPGTCRPIKTGLTIELPKNTEAQIRPRSGLALKNGITVLNTPGTVDEGFRGEIMVILINHSNEWFEIKKHMRIAQMVFAPVLKANFFEVDSLSETKRGVNGYGSTGV